MTQAASATVPVGNVISQNPAGGASAALGSAVNLVISAGAVSVTVPNVVGLAQAAAESAISNAGLVPVVSTAYSATVPAGNVISQNPSGGASVGLGSSVSLVVSLGEAPDDYTGAEPSAEPLGDAGRRFAATDLGCLDRQRGRDRLFDSPLYR